MQHLNNKYGLFRTLGVIALFIAFLVGAAPLSQAQRYRANNDERRKEWMSQMRQFKHEFFKKKLALTRDQETPFFKAYDQMDDELIRIGEETRALERKAISNADASDTELESAARTLFEQKKKEGEVELKYFEEFSKILTKKQLIKLKETERQFNRELLNNSRETKDGIKKTR